MIRSTRSYPLVAAALAAGCGGDEECEVRVLEPCPDCGSGDVLRALVGEVVVTPRPEGGHVGLSCHGELVWHDREMETEATTPLGGDPSASIAVIGEVAFVSVRTDEVEELVAVDQQGNLRWREPMDPEVYAQISAAGESLFLFTTVVEGLLGEAVPPGSTVGRVDPADGRLVWWWQPPVGAAPSGVAPLASGGAIVAGTFTRSVDFGTGEALAGGDGAGFVLELGADGAPLWARAITGTVSVRIDAVATSATGDIAIAGLRGGEVDLGGGVVVPNGEDGFAALLGPDGSGRWGAAFSDRNEPSAVIAAGGAVVAAGRRFSGDLTDDMFVGAVRDGALVWEHHAVSGWNDNLRALKRTADDTALVVIDIGYRAENDGGDPSLRVGRLEVDGEGGRVLEVRP